MSARTQRAWPRPPGRRKSAPTHFQHENLSGASRGSYYSASLLFVDFFYISSMKSIPVIRPRLELQDWEDPRRYGGPAALWRQSRSQTIWIPQLCLPGPSFSASATGASTYFSKWSSTPALLPEPRKLPLGVRNLFSIPSHAEWETYWKCS
jgi:hypothetical protein